MSQSLLLAGLLWSVAAPPPKEAPKKDEAPSIEGTWEVHKMIAAGMEQPVPAITLEFTSDKKIRLRRSKEEKADALEHTFKVDASKSPAELDWSFDGKEEQTLKMIYKIEKEYLTICFEDGFDSKRPEKFESMPGTKLMVWTLMKIEKKKE